MTHGGCPTLSFCEGGSCNVEQANRNLLSAHSSSTLDRNRERHIAVRVVKVNNNLAHAHPYYKMKFTARSIYRALYDQNKG